MKCYKLLTILLLSLFACKTMEQVSIEKSEISESNTGITQIEPQQQLKNEKVNRLAQYYLNGINTDVDYKKAFVHFRYLAKQGDPRGLNGVAGMYRLGMGVEQDQVKARQLYKKASDSGYGTASYNLAHMYRTAQGGKQDFRKAFEYAHKAREQGYKAATYMLGYLHYKGLGTKQDYTKAVEYFKKGTEMKDSSSLYFLGLCYMGGYGVEQDLEKGKQLIEQAAIMGNDQAVEFITENLEKQFANPKTANKDGNVYPAYRKVKNDAEIDLNGEWTGRILQYDWGKKNVIEEHSLSLQINDNDGILSGNWLQNDSISIELNATRKDGFYQLENMQYLQLWAVTWDLKRLRFAKEIVENGDTILYANLIQFSPQAVEPSSPLMLELKRVKAPQSKTDTHTKTDLRTYPNPFTNELTVEFTAQYAGQYTILLHDLSGHLIHTETVDAEAQRTITKLNTTSLPAGTYLINVKGENLNMGTLVIKNKF